MCSWFHQEMLLNCQRFKVESDEVEALARIETNLNGFIWFMTADSIELKRNMA